MVRTSRRQTLLRTTLPAVEHVEPSEETAIDFSSQPADEADQLTAETDRVQEAEQRIDADRLLPVLIQEMNLPQEAKDHLYQEIQRVRQHPHLSPPRTPPSRPLNPYAPSGWNQQPPTMPPRVNPHNPQTQQQQLGEALADLNALQQRIQTLLAPPQQPPPSDQTCDHTSAAVHRRRPAANVSRPHHPTSHAATIEKVSFMLCPTVTCSCFC